jgi:hypothetical protein
MFVNPNGITKNRVLKAVFMMSSCIRTWWYPEQRSILEKNLFLGPSLFISPFTCFAHYIEASCFRFTYCFIYMQRYRRLLLDAQNITLEAKQPEK